MGKFSKESKMGDLYKNKQTRVIMEEYMPGSSKDPRSKLMFGFSLEAISKYPAAGITEQMLAEMDEKLKAIE